MTARVAAIFILLLYLHKCQHMSRVLYNYQLVSTTIYSMSKYLLGKVEQRRQQLRRGKKKKKEAFACNRFTVGLLEFYSCVTWQ